MAVDKKGLGKSQREFRDSYRKRVKRHTFLQGAIEFITFAAGVAFIVLFAVGISHVNGDGMNPQIPAGSYALVNKVAYIVQEPSRGDVVQTKEGRVYRVIGMPGEKITFNGGFVYANGKVLNESEYLGNNEKNMSTIYSDETYVIPDSQYMVLCDDRNCFQDSRENGLFITKDNIEGKVFFAF